MPAESLEHGERTNSGSIRDSDATLRTAESALFPRLLGATRNSMSKTDRLRALIYEPNGGSSYIYELALGLASHLDVRIATNADWKRNHSKADAIAAAILWPITPIARPLQKLLPRLHNHMAAASFSRRWLPHIVHFHYFQHAVLDYPLFCYLRRRHVLVATVHNVAPHGQANVRSAKWDTRLFRLFDRLIVHHDSLKVLLSTVHGIAADRIRVIPRCLPDGGMFDVTRQPRSESRQALGLNCDDFVVLLFGALRKDKRVDVMIEALALLPDTVKLVIAGSGRNREQEISAVTARAGVSDERIVRRLRFVPHDGVSLFFNTADVVAMPYENFHGQSANLFTAYVFGKPVIVSNEGAMGETVSADQTGIVIDKLGAQAVADAIDKLRLPGAYEEWRRNVTLAQDRYSAERCAVATYGLYTDICSRQGKL